MKLSAPEFLRDYSPCTALCRVPTTPGKPMEHGCRKEQSRQTRRTGLNRSRATLNRKKVLPFCGMEKRASRRSQSLSPRRLRHHPLRWRLRRRLPRQLRPSRPPVPQPQHPSPFPNRIAISQFCAVAYPLPRRENRPLPTQWVRPSQARLRRQRLRSPPLPRFSSFLQFPTPPAPSLAPTLTP